MNEVGIFDSWRRKRKTETQVKLQEPRKIKPVGSKETEAITDKEQSKLVIEYNELVRKKDALQAERDEITARLDRGEIDDTAFRKELMNRIQEAANVSDKIRETAAKLVSLGYRGIL